MKLTLLYSFFLLSSMLTTNAQAMSSGLFVNKERNEFVIIRNDTIQFRIFNDDAFATFTIGEGLLKSKENGSHTIVASTSFIEKTSVLYSYPRNDNRLSIQALGQDGLPMAFATIKISQLQRRPYVMRGHSDESGRLHLNLEQIDQFDKTDVSIHVSLIGYTPTKKKVQLKKGYDYIIRSRIPTLLSGSIAGGSSWKIRQLEEGKISLSNGRNTTELKKIVDVYPCMDFPFEKDLNLGR